MTTDTAVGVTKIVVADKSKSLSPRAASTTNNVPLIEPLPEIPYTVMIHILIW